MDKFSNSNKLKNGKFDLYKKINGILFFLFKNLTALKTINLKTFINQLIVYFKISN